VVRPRGRDLLVAASEEDLVIADVTETMPADIRAAQCEHEFLAPAAPVSGEWGESRRFPRYECRSCIDVVIHPPANDPTQQSQACQMLTRDISRGGMNFLHKAQTFPGQLIDLVLPNGQERRLEVMWCRRLGAGCYTSGCRFVRFDDKGRLHVDDGSDPG
jgi:hypothetical protein